MYILFDIGGTSLRVATSDNLKKLEDPVLLATPQDYKEGLTLLSQTFNDLTRDKKIVGAAGGIAGPLNSEKSQLVASPHLPDWANRPIQKDLEKILKAPVQLQNDSALVGLGEAVFGAGRDTEIVVYVTVSTGLGGSRFVNGKIDANSMGFEPGHQIISLTSPHWINNNKLGYLEDYVSGKAILKRYKKNPQDISDPKIWDEAAKMLAIGLNNMIVHWSPECIVLGGSTMKKIPLESVRKYTKDALRIFPTPPKICRAELGNFGGLYGAMAYLGK